MLRCTRLAILATVALALCAWAQAGDQPGHGSDKDHKMVRPDDIKWDPAPPVLPAGALAAVLAGDPSQEVPFVIRVKFPDGYKVPPHWHPTDENVTVLQGTFLMGKGEQFNPNAAEALPAGSFVRMPKEVRHFAQAKGETIIQIHGIGPFQITYVNETDDPRKK
jgi:quercetin dioxygenase-like cupin family protein